MYLTQNTLNKTISLEINHYPNIKLDTSLFFYGNTGTGKTYKSKQLALEFFNLYSQASGYFTTYIDLINEYKFSLGKSALEGRKKIKEYKECFLLIIDDLGTEKVTEFSCQTFFEILNYRVENFLPTIITSNLSLDELKTKYGERITRRIQDYCTLHHFTKRIIPKKRIIEFKEEIKGSDGIYTNDSTEYSKNRKLKQWNAFVRGYMSATSKTGNSLNYFINRMKPKFLNN
jgi:DNA replication protein DnaC